MTRIAAALAMSTTFLFAGYKVDLDKLPVRTLPQETYGKLVKAKGWNGLSWAWKDEDYDHSLGWAIQNVSFRSSKELPAPSQHYLKEALGKLEDRQSPYRLNLGVPQQTCIGESTGGQRAVYDLSESSSPNA